MKHFLVGSVIEANEEEHMALKFTWKLWRRLYGLLRISPDHLTILQENGLIFSQQLWFRSVSTSEMRTDRPLSLKKLKHFFTHMYIYTRFKKSCNLKIYIKYIYLLFSRQKLCLFLMRKEHIYIQYTFSNFQRFWKRYIYTNLH